VTMPSVSDETKTDTTPRASPLDTELAFLSDKTNVDQLDSGISSAFLPPI